MTILAPLPSFDPIINFGKYARGGTHYEGDKRLSQLDQGYLSWLSKRLDDKAQGPVISRGMNWSMLAKQELKRRVDGTPVAIQEDSGVEMEILDDPILPSSGKSKLALTFEAVDDATTLLLRDFITRYDKEQKFCAWLRHLGEEALKYGKKQPRGQDHIWNLKVEYVKMIFTFHEGDQLHTLQKIGLIIPNQVESGPVKK